MARHAWDITAIEASILEEMLRSRVDHQTPLTDLSLLGVATIVDGGTRIRAAIVVSAPSGEMLDAATAEVRPLLEVPPALASFREVPALLAAWEKLTLVPDAIVVEERGEFPLGRAAHLGLLLDLPTIAWQGRARPGHLCNAQSAAAFSDEPPGLTRARALVLHPDSALQIGSR